MVVSNYIVTISNEGLLVIINKNDGNILRINNILKNIKKKKEKNIIQLVLSLVMTKFILQL